MISGTQKLLVNQAENNIDLLKMTLEILMK
jgi:hypothetical protein